MTIFRRKIRSSTDEAQKMRSKSMSSPINRSETLDRKTKQKLFFECNVCVLGQQRLRTDERFNQNKAEVLMNRMYNKRQSHCILYCLEDSIRFQKSKLLGANPKRNFVRYGCIKHVFLFEDKPDAMMLCIDSGRSDRRTYEVFKFKSRENVLTVCEYIYKATQDPYYVLRDIAPIREVSGLSDSSIPAHYRSVPEMELSDHHTLSLASRSAERQREISQAPLAEYHKERSARPVKIKPIAAEDTILDQHSPGVHYVQLKYQTNFSGHEILGPEQLQEKIRKRTNDADWVVNITYLQWDNERGATINDRGPIYMYVARRLRDSH